MSSHVSWRDMTLEMVASLTSNVPEFDAVVAFSNTNCNLQFENSRESQFPMQFQMYVCGRFVKQL